MSLGIISRPESRLTTHISAQELIPAFAAITSDGYRANSSNVTHMSKVLGLKLEDNTSAWPLTTVVVRGEIQNPNWNWNPGQTVYLNGTTLSHTPPITGFLLSVGYARDHRALVVDKALLPSPYSPSLVWNETNGLYYQICCRNNEDGVSELFLKPLIYLVCEDTGDFYQLMCRLNEDGILELFLTEVSPLVMPAEVFVTNETTGIPQEMGCRLNADGVVEWYLYDTGEPGHVSCTKLPVMCETDGIPRDFGCRNNEDSVTELYAPD